MKQNVEDFFWVVVTGIIATVVLLAALVVISVPNFEAQHEITYPVEHVVVITYRVRDPLLGNAVYYYLTNSTIDPDIEIEWKYVILIGEKLTLCWKVKEYDNPAFSSMTVIRLYNWTFGW